MCQFQVYSKVIEFTHTHTHIHTLFQIFSHIGYHRILSRVAYAIQ